MVEKRLLTINQFSRPGEKLHSIHSLVFHWVGNANTSDSANARYFETLSKQDPFDDEDDIYASAHYVLDDDSIIQMIPDDEIAYHAGSSWWNRNSIGIEICHPDWTGKFTEKTMKNLTSLAVQLCIKHEIDPLGDKRFMRHYDITKKMCPLYWVEHPEEFAHFKTIVSRYL